MQSTCSGRGGLPWIIPFLDGPTGQLVSGCKRKVCDPGIGVNTSLFTATSVVGRAKRTNWCNRYPYSPVMASRIAT